MIGEENRGGDQHRDDNNSDKSADHDGCADFAGVSVGAPPGASAGVARRANSSSCKCANATSALSRTCACSNQDWTASDLGPETVWSAETAPGRSPRTIAAWATLIAGSCPVCEAALMRRMVTNECSQANV